MTREQAKREIDNIDFYLQHHTDDYSERSHDAMMMAIQALSQEPCDDAISRILKKMWNCRGKHTTSIDKVAMEQIIRDELPPVTHKSGKWINTADACMSDNIVCSKCGYNSIASYNYCPNCGAKMVEPQESEDK